MPTYAPANFKKAFTLAEGGIMPQNIRLKTGKAAFTLAEVLITLTIIGIVAALTMPSLIAKYQKKVTAVRVKKAYSDISQAIKMSEAYNGPFKDWDYANGANEKENTLNLVNKYIIPYVKNLNYCDQGASRKCGNPVSSNGQNYIFNNGVGFSIVADGIGFPFMLDTNGPQRPNIIGRDVFYFNITKEGSVVPFGWDDNLTREQIIEGKNAIYIFARCKMPPSDLPRPDGSGVQYNGYLYMCTAMLMYDGWEFKDDYPWMP